MRETPSPTLNPLAFFLYRKSCEEKGSPYLRKNTVLRFLDPVFPISLYTEPVEKMRGRSGIGDFEEREVAYSNPVGNEWVKKSKLQVSVPLMLLGFKRIPLPWADLLSFVSHTSAGDLPSRGCCADKDSSLY